MNITEFLLARIAEDEAVARSAEASNPGRLGYVTSGPAFAKWKADGGSVYGGTGALWDCEGSDAPCISNEVTIHMAHYDPARAIDECAAKRAVVELHQAFSEFDETGAIDMWSATVAVLKLLATVYKGHPDYQQAWV